MSDPFDINEILEAKANSMISERNTELGIKEEIIDINNPSTISENIKEANYVSNKTNDINNIEVIDDTNNSLLEETSHVLKQLRDYETCGLEIKKEVVDSYPQNVVVLTEDSNFCVKIEPEFTNGRACINMGVLESDEIQIKNEILDEYHSCDERGLNDIDKFLDKNLHNNIKLESEESDVVSYDYPQFDGHGVESALDNVEACLDKDPTIKTECDEDRPTNCAVNCELGATDPSQTNENLDNIQIKQEDGNTDGANNPSEPNSGFENLFQLSSIAEGAIKSTKTKLPKTIPCPECSNMYSTKHSLLKHLEVHQTIKNYDEGRKKALATRKRNEWLKEQLYNQNNPVEVTEKDKTGNTCKYLCTCGKKFKRRTTMESCLRTHNDIGECSTHSCYICNKQFKTKNELQKHRKRLHSRKKFPCKFCPTEYKTQRKLVKHLRKHRKVQLTEFEVISKVGSKFKCPMCRNNFKDYSELKTHITTEHKPPYSCKKCNDTLPSILEFTTHFKSKHSEAESDPILDALEAFTKLAQEWKCADCHLQFNKAEDLAVHKLEQHTAETKALIDAETQFQCIDCSRVFASSKSLNIHRRIHHTIENTNETVEELNGLLCLHCRKICKDDIVLASHMRFHSPDRKYVCKFCDFRFATPEKRKTHAEIHTGDLKYVCFICEYQCSSFQRLTTHKKSAKHLSMKEYLLTGNLIPLEENKISVKPKGDKTKKPRLSDESKGGKESSDSSSDDDDGEKSGEVICDVCEAKFSSPSEMSEHKLTHPFIEFPNEETPTRIFFK